MSITNFSQIEKHLTDTRRRSTLAVVMATDHTTRSAVARALDCGIVNAIFIGARAQVEADPAIMRHADAISIQDSDDADAACAAAVEAVRTGEADVLMKGMVNTDNLLRAVLNKQTGILAPGDVLTHVTVAEIPTYHKLLIFSDAAVIPYPTDAQRHAQIQYVLHIAHKIGVECPRISLIHCSEKVDGRHFPFTEDYVSLRESSASGALGNCIVDGPLDVKTSCSKAALDKKGLVSAIDGDADALIFPDIEAGNTFYKTITLFAGASTAGLICGCSAPVILPSRGDSVDSKYHSLLIAILCGALK